MIYIKQTVSLCSCRKRKMAEILDLIKESLQLSANLLSLVTLDNAIENYIRRMTLFKSFFLKAQIVYKFDLPADFVQGIHEVDNFLSNKINELGRRFDMIGTCKQGRPRYQIQELERLRDLGFTWKKIAEIVCVSERTLRTKRHELEITDKYTGIRDNELNNFIQEILEESPNKGRKNASRSSAITWYSNSVEAFALLH